VGSPGASRLSRHGPEVRPDRAGAPRARVREELALCNNAGVAMGISLQTDMATPALARFVRPPRRRRRLVDARRSAARCCTGHPTRR